MIQVHNLSKTYNNGVKVLNVQNLEIPKGQSFGLVGNNGAGKTTFFSLLLDLCLETICLLKSKKSTNPKNTQPSLHTNKKANYYSLMTNH